MLSQDSFDSVHSPTLSITEDEMEDEDDAMELLGTLIFTAGSGASQQTFESVHNQSQNIPEFGLMDGWMDGWCKCVSTCAFVCV